MKDLYLTQAKPSYSGLEHFFDLILEQFDSNAPPPTKETLTPPPAKEPHTLRNHMDLETKHLIQTRIKPAIREIFSLHPNSITTLRALDIPETTLQFVLSLNYLAMVKGAHHVNDRLRTIAALPHTLDTKSSPNGPNGGWTTGTPA